MKKMFNRERKTEVQHCGHFVRSSTVFHVRLKCLIQNEILGLLIKVPTQAFDLFKCIIYLDMLQGIEVVHILDSIFVISSSCYAFYDYFIQQFYYC